MFELVWSCVEDRGLSCLKKAFRVSGQRKNGRRVGTWKKQVEGRSMKIGLSREDVLC